MLRQQHRNLVPPGCTQQEAVSPLANRRFRTAATSALKLISLIATANLQRQENRAAGKGGDAE
jgi:hypothetical protein